MSVQPKLTLRELLDSFTTNASGAYRTRFGNALIVLEKHPLDLERYVLNWINWRREMRGVPPIPLPPEWLQP